MYEFVEMFVMVGVLFIFLTFALALRALYVTLRMAFARGPSLSLKARLRTIAAAWGTCLASALVSVLIFPNPGCAPGTARRSQCMNNLKQIVLAMHNYHDVYGCFPPAYTVDKAGRPLHSWRVLLLPVMEARALPPLRLDEPYNSPRNQASFDSMQRGHGGFPSVASLFQCPSDRENRTDTNYVMLLGPRTVSNGPNSVRLKEITDGVSSTIAVVETYGLGIRWYEPRDLRVEGMSFQINDPEHVGIASRHPGGANAAFADGSVRFLSDDTNPRLVEAMTTINGGENVSAVLNER